MQQVCIDAESWNFRAESETHTLYVYGRIDSYKQNFSTPTNLLSDMVYDLPNALNNLHGAFAGILTDKRNGSFTVFNDHYDLETWYWTNNTSGTLILSPRLERILRRSDCHHAVNKSYLNIFLSPHYALEEGCFSNTSTAFENISKLDYASVAHFIEDKLVSISQYWNPYNLFDQGEKRSFNDICEEFRELLLSVIKEQIDSTKRNFACDISGGIDSGCVASSLGVLFSDPFTAVTVMCAPDDWEYEHEKVRSILNKFPHIIHQCVEGNTLYEQSTPIVHPARINMPDALWKYTSELTSHGIQHLFSGEGGDWYLEGSDYIWDSAFRERKYGLMSQTLLRMIERGGIRDTFAYASKVIAPQLIGGQYSKHRVLETELPNLGHRSDVYPAWIHKSVQESNRPVYEAARQSFLKSRIKTWENIITSTLMFPPVHKWKGIAQTSMVFPYYDKRLMEFGLSIPNYQKFVLSENARTSYGAKKQIQRVTMRGIVPTLILGCQHKATYSFPVTNRVEKIAKSLFSRNQVFLGEFGFINPNILVKNLDTLSGDDDMWVDAAIAAELWLTKIHSERIIH